MNLYEQLRALNEGDHVTVRTDERKVRGTVTDTDYVEDNGYADGHLSVEIYAEWDDVKDVCTSEMVSVSIGTDITGRWKTDTHLSGWHGERENDLVTDYSSISLGSVESIDHE